MELMTQRKFKGWETKLSPDSLNLLSILTFRRDFLFDKSIEHNAHNAQNAGIAGFLFYHINLPIIFRFYHMI